MQHKYNNKKRGEDNLLSTFLRLPVRNLETRINELEKDIRCRQKIKDDILTNLGSRRLQLEDKIWNMRYIGLTNPRLDNLGVLGQLIMIEKQISNEITSCFKDVIELKEKLNQFREELESTRQKLKLMDFKV